MSIALNDPIPDASSAPALEESQPMPNISVRVGSIDLDRPMTPAQFGKWIGKSARWVQRHLRQIPGVIRHSDRSCHIIPRYYVEQPEKRTRKF